MSDSLNDPFPDCSDDFGSAELCDLCDGTGDYGEWYCPDCKGSGVIFDEGDDA